MWGFDISYAVNCYQKAKHPWQPDKNWIIILSLERMQLCQKLLNVELLEFSISLLERGHSNFSWGLSSICNISSPAWHTLGLYTFIAFTDPRICPISFLHANAALKNTGRSAEWKKGRKAGLLRDTSDTVKMLILQTSSFFSWASVSSCVKVA